MGSDDAARRPREADSNYPRRLERAEWRLDRLEEWRKEMAKLNPEVLQMQLEGLRSDVADLRTEVGRQRRVANAVLLSLIAAALSFAFMAITIAVTG